MTRESATSLDSNESGTFPGQMELFPVREEWRTGSATAGRAEQQIRRDIARGWIGTAELSQLIKVGRKAIRRHCENGSWPCHKVDLGFSGTRFHYRFSPEDVARIEQLLRGAA